MEERMSLENVKKFYERLAKDESLRQAIQSVQSKNECSRIVKQAGFDFTAEEFERYNRALLERKLPERELNVLSEEDLMSVVGGYIDIPNHPVQEYGIPPGLWQYD
jgi:predicted ribosomally synthesized peptide with nif11-like leader